MRCEKALTVPRYSKWPQRRRVDSSHSESFFSSPPSSRRLTLAITCRTSEAPLLGGQVDCLLGRHLHRMTSSARSKTGSAMVIPSSRAVLRLTTSVNWVGCSIGRPPGLAPLKILSTYPRGSAQLVLITRPVRQESAFVGILPLPRDDGQPSLRGQLENRRSIRKERRGVDHVQCLRLRSVDALYGWTDLIGSSHAHEAEFDRQRRRYCLEVLDCFRMIRRGRIPEDDDSGKARHRFFEQLQALGGKFSQHDR